MRIGRIGGRLAVENGGRDHEPPRLKRGRPHCTMIRPATQADEDAIWNIFQAVVAPGDTYVFDPQTPREKALTYWFRPDTHTYVAEIDGRVVGTYIIKPNQPALGSHIANAAFMVSVANCPSCRSHA
jgi:L-amino acid N-acyltransferase YncA